MFQTKRKLREKNAELMRRVEQLEEMICPMNEHDWVEIDHNLVTFTNGFDWEVEHKYKCRRCGKIRTSIW